jgi:hypothetical protein
LTLSIENGNVFSFRNERINLTIEVVQMITREAIIDEIQKIPENYLADLYKIIKNFEADKEMEPKQSLMSKLRNIKIKGPKDFSENIDLYLYGEKRVE